MPEPGLSGLLGDLRRILSERLGHDPDVAMIEARALAGAALGVSQAGVLALENREVSGEVRDRLRRLVERRLRHEPVAHITGRREFYSIDILVSANVLVPRPETELVVDRVLATVPRDYPGQIADLGTGSGAVAVALAANLPRCRVVASDVDPNALANATANVEHHRIRNVEIRRSDWLSGFAPGERFGVIVANPPYLTTQEARSRAGDLAHEPDIAFDGGEDGLDALRLIARDAPGHLEPGGTLVVEHGFTHWEPVAGIFSRAGFVEVGSFDDLAGLARVTSGRVPPAS